MDGDHGYSHQLAKRLQRAGLGSLAAAVLEAGAPLAPFAAQLSYLVEPFLGESGDEAARLARLLEDPQRLSELVWRLREDSEGWGSTSLD
jgi:hypothetical protein